MNVPHSPKLRRIALRTAVAYWVLAGLWILTSDTIVGWLVTDPALMAKLSIAKGWFFVAFTGALLFVALRRQLRHGEAEAEARIRAVKELREQRWRLDSIIEGTHVGTWEWNVHTGDVVFNERWAEIVGYTLAELQPVSIKTWERLAHPDDLAVSGQLLEKHFAGQSEHYEIECRMRHKAGHWVWVLDRGRLMTRTADGRPGLMFGTHTDITARKQAELALRENEERQRLFFEHAPAAIAILDRDMRYVAATRRWLAVHGLTGRSVVGHSHYELFPKVPDEWRVVHRRALDGEVVAAELDRVSLPNGDERWIGWETRPWFGADGAIAGIAIFVEDITERVAAAEALRASEERYRAVVESAPFAIFVQTGGRFAYLNPKARLLLDPTGQATLVGQPVAGFFTPDEPAVGAPVLAALERAERVAEMALRIRRPEGGAVDLRISAEPFSLNGQPGALVFVRDVTEEKRAVESLRLHEAVLRETGKIARVGGWSFDAATGDGFWTEEVARIHDGDPSEPVTRDRTLQFYRGESRRRLDAALKAAVEHGIPYDLELELITATGRRKWVRTIGHPILEHGRVVRLRGSFQDVTELHDATLALRESEERFRQIAENINEVFWIFDVLTSRLVYISPAFETMWGRSIDAVRSGKVQWSDAIHPDDAPRILPDLRERQMRGEYEEVYRIILPDGGIRWIHDRAFAIRNAEGRVYRIIGTAEDITERHRLEEQFRHAQKMQAIGTLAGGIAHDFNNLLGAITGFAEITRIQVADRPEVRENVDDILRAGKRAIALVRQILAFSRRSASERVLMQLRPIVDEAVHLLRSTIPSTIAISSEMRRDVPPVVADPTQVHQVIMNLGTNAWHAMRERPGRLEVRLERCEIDATRSRQDPRLRAGVFARVSMRDTGCGIPPELLDRIFEPFFTTKAPGDGTGLGLSVVHGILRDHEGFVTVDSVVGAGSEFCIYFPAAEVEVPASSGGPATLRRGRGERILFVDDEEPLVRLGVEMLERLGYAAEGAAGAEAALARVTAQPEHFDLVITDQTMPAMTGIVLAQAMRRVRPGLPVIVVTGHSADIGAEQVGKNGVQDLLMKPLSLDTLGSSVFRVLNAPAPA